MSKSESEKILHVNTDGSPKKKRSSNRVLKITSLTVDNTDVKAHKEAFKSLLGIFPAACGVIWRNEQIYT